MGKSKRGKLALMAAVTAVGFGMAARTAHATKTWTGDTSATNLWLDGTNWLVTWTDQRSGGAEVYGGRVSTAGVGLEAVAVVEAHSGERLSHCAGDLDPVCEEALSARQHQAVDPELEVVWSRGAARDQFLPSPVR